MRSPPRRRSPAWSASTAATRSSWRRRTGWRIAATGSPTHSTRGSRPRVGRRAFTALTVVSLIEDGLARARDDGPLGARRGSAADRRRRDDRASPRRTDRGSATTSTRMSSTDITDYLLPVPVHELATTEQYLAVLDGHRPSSPPGERFAYCNGGYVVLALIAERASGVPFHDLVRRRVCEPAGMDDTAFLRSDELPGTRRARLPRGRRRRGPMCSTSPCAGAETAGSTPRGGHPRVLGRALRRADRVEGVGRGDGASSQ